MLNEHQLRVESRHIIERALRWQVGPGELQVLRGEVWATRRGAPDDWVLQPGQRLRVGPTDDLVLEPWAAGRPVELRWRPAGLASAGARRVAALAAGLWTVLARRLGHAADAAHARAAAAACRAGGLGHNAGHEPAGSLGALT